MAPARWATIPSSLVGLAPEKETASPAFTAPPDTSRLILPPSTVWIRLKTRFSERRRNRRRPETNVDRGKPRLIVFLQTTGRRLLGGIGQFGEEQTEQELALLHGRQTGVCTGASASLKLPLPVRRPRNAPALADPTAAAGS